MPSLFHHHSKKNLLPNHSSPSRSRSPEPFAAANVVPDSLTLRRQNSAEQGLWQQAWDEVRGDLVEKLPPEFERLDTFTLRSEVQYVQDEAQSRRDATETNERTVFSSRHRYRKIFDKIAKCAQKFEIVGDMVAQAEPVYAALPWAFVRFIISCAVGESETYHSMLEATELVLGFILQYPVIEHLYAKLDSKPSMALSKSLLKFYKVILDFQVHAIRYFDPDRKVKRTFQGLNPVTADTIKQRCQSIENARKGVDQDINIVVAEVTKVGIDNIKESQAGQEQQLEAIKSGVRALSEGTEAMIMEVDARQQKRNDVLIELWKRPLNDLKENFELERIEREKENLYDIRRWLSSAEYETNHSEAKEKRQLKLGSWLLKDEKFGTWQSSEQSSLLWLHGFAGTGKTGLVSRVIDHLRDKLKSEEFVDDSEEEPARLAFFYCSNDKVNSSRQEVSSRADPEEALRSIVSQLCTSQQGRTVAPILQEKYNSFGRHSDNYRKLNYSDCVEVLVSVSEYTQIVVIFDAFDECNKGESPNLIRHLRDVLRQSPKNIKIFISTRPFPAIADDLASDHSIEVTADRNGEDVGIFIQDTLEARVKDHSLLNGNVNDELRKYIQTTLSNRAGSMFLYASLLINQLCDKNRNDDEESIRKKLGSLPKNLTDLYHSVMLEIHDDRNNSERSCLIAQSTLKWLLAAQEPLQCDTLIEAISPHERKANHKEIMDACRTLIVQKKDVFEFAHYSVREHVGQMPEYSASKCHIVATTSCLRILNTTIGAGRPRAELSVSQKSFEKYALVYWPLHYEGIIQEDKGEHASIINAMLRTFLLQGRSKNDKYRDWFTQAEQNVKQSRNNQYLTVKLHALQASPLTPLFAACVFGLDDLISKFGRELDGLNKYNDHGQSALCLAIENDKLEVVEALLSRRFPADPNLLNVNAVRQFVELKEAKPPEIILYASALQCAAATGRFKIAHFLIEHGAHIDLVAGFYGSPLQAASLKGHSAIVELLLKKGAEPNSQGGFYGNALQAAAVGGHVNVINLLLENKPPALVNTPGGQYGSALMAAVCSGNSDTVFALLDEYADPKARNAVYGTPLEKAASMGPEWREITKDLLEYKGDVDLSPKGHAIHILHQAAMYNLQELVKHCLDEGCNINMTTTEGPRYPRRFGDFPREMTPLAYACAEGHVGMVDLLLDRDAAIERDKDPSAVLWTAAYRGHTGVVKLLLDRFKAKHSPEELTHFMNQRPHPKAGHWVLFAAASSHSPETVSTLVDYGAEYKSNWFNATPLLATATFACPNICKRLLEYHREGKIDVRINQRANNGRTAIFEAYANSRHIIAEQLLEAGADYLIPDNDNGTCLHKACHHENFRLISSLMKKASEDLSGPRLLKFLDTRHESGKTALIDCAERNRLPHLNLLLDYGADYTIYGGAGNTPLHWASRLGHEEVVAALVKKAQREDGESRPFQSYLDHRNKLGITALMEAARENRLPIVQLLLDRGADHTISDDFNITALHIASFRGFQELVTVLLGRASQDFDQRRFKDFVNRRNKLGKTALMDAAETNRSTVMNMLLDYGADYSIEDNNAFTALHYCAFRNHMPCVRILLERTSHDTSDNGNKFRRFLNQQGVHNGASALSDTARQRNTDVAVLLISFGAEYNTYDSKKRTPLHLALEREDTGLALELLAYAKRDGNIEKLRRFVNAKDANGMTAWKRAQNKHNVRLMDALRDSGVAETV